jgi:Ca2+-binding EF-hand superfamily protein
LGAFEKVFREFDKDGSGFLDRAELLDALKCLGVFGVWFLGFGFGFG